MVLDPPTNEPSTPILAGPCWLRLLCVFGCHVCVVLSVTISRVGIGQSAGWEAGWAHRCFMLLQTLKLTLLYSQTEGKDAGSLRRDFGMYLPSDGAAPGSPFSPGGIQHANLVPELESSHILSWTSPSFLPLPWSVSPQHSDMHNEPGRLWGFLK